MELSSKRADVNMVLAGVMTLTLAAFLLVMGLLILDDVLYSTTATTAVTDLNEPETTVNATAETVDSVGLCGFHAFTILNVTNASSGVLVNPLHYEVVNQYLGTWRLTSAGQANATIANYDMNISYTYEYGVGDVCKTANKTIVGQGKFGNYIDLIVLAIIISIIIGMLLVIMATRRTK